MLGKRTELGTGLRYGNRDVSSLAYCDCILPSQNTVQTYHPQRSIELPVEWRWKWFKQSKKINPYVSLGVNNYIPIDYFGGSTRDKVRLQLSDFYSGIMLGIGSRIHLFEKWSMIVAVSGEKNSNFKFEKKSYFKPNRWLDEWSAKIGVARNF